MHAAGQNPQDARCALRNGLRWHRKQRHIPAVLMGDDLTSRPLHRKQDEVLYKAYRKGRYSPYAAGLQKICKCCDLARRRDQQWLWVDTCCIDKGSSAELSEAINSMFYYYNKAEECYAFLSDVSTAAGADLLDGLQKSQWFTRGWTLQELIAPQRVVFIASTWDIIGEKWFPESDSHLGDIISNITGIPLEVLAVPQSRFFFSVSIDMHA